jgi:uncharacterized RDD family membrane protein YckC
MLFRGLAAVPASMSTPSQPALAGLALAGLWRRLAALMYEAILAFAIVFVAAYLFIALARDTPSGWLRLVFYTYLLCVCGAYFVFCWVRTGQTLAQKTWNLRLTDLDGSLLRPPRAILRYLLALPSVGSGLGLIWALIDPERQFLHDRLIGSRLVATDAARPPLEDTGQN